MLTPVSSHTASRDPGGLGRSFKSQPEGGRHIESQTHPDPCNATEQLSAAPLQHYQAHMRYLVVGSDRPKSERFNFLATNCR